MIRSYHWPSLYKELNHNIEEEKGLHTDGVPHLVTMRDGYRDELGINVDDVEVYPCTKIFLASL